jgi:hypothetical protein
LQWLDTILAMSSQRLAMAFQWLFNGKMVFWQRLGNGYWKFSQRLRNGKTVFFDLAIAMAFLSTKY